jgi:hypothetical protein
MTASACRLAVLLGLAAGMLVARPAWAEAYGLAVLRALDKVTGRTTQLEAPVGEPLRFGALEIMVRTCDKRPPEETPESAAFLEIVERRPAQPEVTVFRGWMFASSPGLSAMQHPVYDVWVLDCENKLSSTEPSAPSEALE